jgi:hypothetical protein
VASTGAWHAAAMATVRATAEAHVDAPAAAAYAVLADLGGRHRRILPPAFSDYEVEAGGDGAGTVVRYSFTAGGRTRRYRMQVAEPEPGRVLTESDTESSLVTTFTVEPEGSGCRVRIETTWEGARGVGGFFERRFAPPALRRVYGEELANLQALLASGDG